MRRLAALASIAVLVSACSMIPDVAQLPQACIDVYSANQCVAITDVAAAEVSKNRGDVVGIVIVPDAPPDGATLGGAWPIHVRAAFRDGTTHDVRMCGGLSLDPACSADPHLSPRSVMGGYTDVPCGAEPADAPADCPTPFPSPEAEVVAESSPLVVDDLSIPIDRAGRYEVPVGRGSLPNGILGDASFAFADAWPDDVALRDGTAFLEVRSLEPDGKPFDNYYMHGWRPGVERFEAVLLFDVLWFQPGADLTIQNVVVR